MTNHKTPEQFASSIAFGIIGQCTLAGCPLNDAQQGVIHDASLAAVRAELHLVTKKRRR